MVVEGRICASHVDRWSTGCDYPVDVSRHEIFPHMYTIIGKLSFRHPRNSP